MEIEFNTSRVPKPGYSEPVARQAASPTAPSPTALASDSTAQVTNKLEHLPTVRPEKVAQAQVLVSNDKYPPDDVLDRIAVLLALKVKQ